MCILNDNLRSIHDSTLVHALCSLVLFLLFRVDSCIHLAYILFRLLLEIDETLHHSLLVDKFYLPDGIHMGNYSVCISSPYVSDNALHLLEFRLRTRIHFVYRRHLDYDTYLRILDSLLCCDLAAV